MTSSDSQKSRSATKSSLGAQASKVRKADNPSKKREEKVAVIEEMKTNEEDAKSSGYPGPSGASSKDENCINTLTENGRRDHGGDEDDFTIIQKDPS